MDDMRAVYLLTIGCLFCGGMVGFGLGRESRKDMRHFLRGAGFALMLFLSGWGFMDVCATAGHIISSPRVNDGN